MIDQLEIIRDKIDDVDKKIIMLLAKRLTLVSEIGHIKNKFGMPIYVPEREESLIKARIQDAANAQISPKLVEDILHRIMQESYIKESTKGYNMLCPSLGSIIIIGNNNREGLFFGKMLTLSGYNVLILAETKLKCSYILLESADMIVINTAIKSIIQIIRKFPKLKKSCLLIELSNIKDEIIQRIFSLYEGPILGLNFIIKPDDDILINKTVIYCEGRDSKKYQWLLKQIQTWGANLIGMSTIEHDQYIFFSQILTNIITFIVGIYSSKEEINFNHMLPLPFSHVIHNLTKFQKSLQPIFQDYKYYFFNSNSTIHMIRNFYKYFSLIMQAIEQKDKQIFMKYFELISSLKELN